MYWLAIVEDDVDQQRIAEQMLERYPRHEAFSTVLLSGADELEAYLAGVGNQRIDVLLTDIMLGEGELDGVDLVRRYFPAGCGTQVIYLTGRIEYCTRVYQTEHIYFLAKPASQQDFDAALDKALDNLKALTEQPVIVRSQGHIVALAPRDILFLESSRRKVLVHMSERTVETYSSLGELIEKLPPTFVQTHKSFVVNMDCIAELRKDDALLHSSQTIPVSQKRRKNVREAFFAHLRTRL